MYLWHAVDQSREVLDILVQTRCNAKAAKRFFQKLLKNLQYVPRAIVTDKPPSYGAAMRDVMPTVVHRCRRPLDNRAENLHRRTRERERAMRGCKSMR